MHVVDLDDYRCSYYYAYDLPVWYGLGKLTVCDKSSTIVAVQVHDAPHNN